MVDQVDRAIAAFGNPAPFLHEHVLHGVVVLGQFVTRDEGIDGQDVDLLVDDFRDECVDYRPHDHGPTISGCCRDDERPVAPAVDKQPVPDIFRLQPVVLGRRLDFALGFFLRVFQVPEPDAQLTVWSNPEEVLARDLCESFCGDQRRLAETAGGNGCGYELPDEDPPVEPGSQGNVGWIDPHIGRGGYQQRLWRCSACASARAGSARGSFAAASCVAGSCGAGSCAAGSGVAGSGTRAAGTVRSACPRSHARKGALLFLVVV